MFKNFVLFVLFIFVFTGCSAIQKRLAPIESPQQRYQNVDFLLKNNGFKSVILSGRSFDVAAWVHITSQQDPISVFIEGDGLAYYSRHRISNDPTPTNAIAARIAVQDSASNKIYLSRPCQYIINHGINQRNCHQRMWSQDRFSRDVITLYQDLLDQIKKQYKNESGFRLMGFSGGGAVAASVSLYRDDVIDVRAVAAPLDIHGLMRYHRADPIVNAVSPYSHAARLAEVKLTLFLGSSDRIVNKRSLKQFLDNFMNKSNFKLIEVEGLEHEGNWHHAWDEYYN